LNDGFPWAAGIYINQPGQGLIPWQAPTYPLNGNITDAGKKKVGVIFFQGSL
jgi:hypothetical protein